MPLHLVTTCCENIGGTQTSMCSITFAVAANMVDARHVTSTCLVCSALSRTKILANDPDDGMIANTASTQVECGRSVIVSQKVEGVRVRVLFAQQYQILQ